MRREDKREASSRRAEERGAGRSSSAVVREGESVRACGHCHR